MTPPLKGRPVGRCRARSLTITTPAARNPALARALTPARTGAVARLLALVLVLTGCQGGPTTTPVSSGPAGIPQRAAAIDVSGLAPRAAYTIFEVTDGACEVVASSGGDDVVPVASVFKLWVLDAAARQVRAGTLRWDTPVIIRDELRSDPSGEAYNIPTGTSVPLQRMLTLMISISDNTATDHVLDLVGRLPDAVLACVGGGSNAMGIFHRFVDDVGVRLVGLEAGGAGVESGRHAARFSGGTRGVLHGAATYVLQDGDGQTLPSHSVSAGLDYPSVGPEHAHLFETGRAEYHPITDAEAMEAFGLLCRTEGILPAIESAHALAGAMRVGRELGPEAVLLVSLSGRGDKDVHTAAQWFGLLEDDSTDGMP